MVFYRNEGFSLLITTNRNLSYEDGFSNYRGWNSHVLFGTGFVLLHTGPPGTDNFIRTFKHAGTFIGLMGIGVTVAGILLYLINRGQSTKPEQTSFDV